MKTNINQMVTNNRLQKTLQRNEQKLVRQQTKDSIAEMRERESRHLLLELELAEALKLGVGKVTQIVNEYNNREELTLANVMN
ncbi:MAG: hypothetical protein LBF15_00680 [Candidatus Peribacteria bacterium]|jgi:hypothetical protein|nr:hypothetical protein [Candidatus Peribacteria bacterium]